MLQCNSDYIISRFYKRKDGEMVVRWLYTTNKGVQVKEERESEGIIRFNPFIDRHSLTKNTARSVIAEHVAPTNE